MESQYDANIFGREFASVPKWLAIPLSFMPRRYVVVGIWEFGGCCDFINGKAA